MFVVDSSDASVVDQSAAILQQTVAAPRLAAKPLLVFANKRDHPSAVSEPEVARRLGLDRLPSGTCTTLVPCVAKPSANNNLVDDRLETGLHWLFDHVQRDFGALDARVQRDLEAKKQFDAKRRADQRARVAAWKEERELAQMARHDKPSSATHLHQNDQQPRPAGAAASSSKADDPEDVIKCSNCTHRPAATKCAASKWMPVCSECATELKAAAAAAAASRG